MALRPTTTKLVLAAAGIALFGFGVRTESQVFRWAGIIAVGCAALLRFWRTPPARRADEGMDRE